MILRVLLYLIQAVHARFRLAQCVCINVGCVEDGALFQTLFPEKNRKGMDFLSTATSRDPNFQGGVRAKMRHYFLADSLEVLGIAKKFANLHGDDPEELIELRRIVQH